jgi:hypothetical protein
LFAFERVVYLNLDRRADRREQFESMMNGLDWPFTRPVRIAAVGARERKIDATHACRASYVERILRPAVADRIGSILMLEDDAEIAANVRQLAETFFAGVPADWKSLFLGNQCQCRETIIAPGVSDCAVPNRAHFWALRGEAIRAAYEWAKYGPDDTGPAAEWTHGNSAHIDHVLSKPLHELGGLYAAKPTWAGQRGGFSDLWRGGSKVPPQWWGKF